MSYLAVWAASFFSVFLLGLQSRNVNQGRYILAVITSFGINVAQFSFVKIASTGSYDIFTASSIGGCMGILSSIWFYKNIIERNGNGKKHSA